MTPIVLHEGGSSVEVALSAVVASALAAADIVTAEPRSSGRWRLRAKDVVGVANVGGVQLVIKPKIPIARLLFLLGYARNPHHWLDADVDMGVEDDLVPAMAHAFERQAEHAVRRGLLQGYRTVEDSLPVLRGRLDVSRQTGRRFGLALPLEARFDDYSVDIPENRLLLAAARRLLTLPDVPAPVRQRLRALTARLADVSPLVRGTVLPRWQPTRLNQCYQNALHLAEIVLGGNSVEIGGAGVRISGFLLRMWRVFEGFATVALAESLRGHGGRMSLQDRRHLDRANEVPIRPDLVWSHGSRPTAVLDAKYKTHGGRSGSNADLYQMLAYCTVLGVRRGHLLYADGERPRSHSVRNADVDIVQHVMDLDQPPHALLGQIEVVAAELRQDAAT
ncbi:McrC family protein [Saccharothrix isguenensis]